ncbi:peroxiredoxin [uncultured Flavobacterium sp.]|uniref:peroxiredoxin n=1 Tax=uncultured Flavobacterium sp. TaxID=165435 RepID=UPI0030EBFAEB|tara:strand:- start:279849 stop:280298 length:450 start_codon:yes stop_codon:yes gene_type:complete
MALKIGDLVPDFKAKTQSGEKFEISNHIGKPLVIYFYPKDNTPGCTTQACSFRDQYQDFQDLGAEVIGVSGDTIESHDKFANKHNLPFILLSDEKRKLRSLFGVPTHFFGLIPGRVTYIIDKEGKVVSVYNSIKANAHIEHALEIVKEM